MEEKRGGKRFVDVVIVGMFLLAAYFAVFGGEYSTFEISRLQKTEAESAAALAVTEAAIDSLRAVAAALDNDPEAIERVAREQYGMIRDGEILYRFREVTAEDSTGSMEEDDDAGGD